MTTRLGKIKNFHIDPHLRPVSRACFRFVHGGIVIASITTIGLLVVQQLRKTYKGLLRIPLIVQLLKRAGAFPRKRCRACQGAPVSPTLISTLADEKTGQW